MARLKIIILILPILLLVSCSKDSRNVQNKKDSQSIIQTDNNVYSKFIGHWYAGEYFNSYDDTFTKGGYVLEIIEINKNYIKGYTASISMPPSNRVAEFNFEGELTDNQLNIDFIDSFDNKGKAIITILKDIVEIKINDFELSDDNASGWGYNGDIIFVSKK